MSTTGNDQTGNGTQGQPWKTLMKCFNEIDAGDTCWFEDGTYLVPEGSSSGSTSAFNEGWDLGGPCVNGLNASPYYCTRDRQNGGTAAAPKKFKAVHTSLAIWKRDTPSTPCRSNMLIRNNVDNLVFQGIKFANNQWIAENGAANITFTENIFMCPGSNDGSNYSSLFSGDNVSPGCTGWHVYNNLFMVDGTCTDNHCGVTGGPSFMHMYSQSGSTFENNDYLVKAGTPYSMEDGLGFKAVNEQTTIRNNYLKVESGEVLSDGIWVANSNHGTSDAATGGNMVYQNVVHGAGTGVRQDQLKVVADKFYNNTLYNVSECYTSSTDAGGWTKTVEFFNNICVKDRGTQVVDWDAQDTGTADVDGQSYLNNNMYQLKGSSGNSYVNKGTSRAGIASWKTYLKDTLGLSSSLNEDVSSEADPLLVNPASFDYRLQTSSPAKTGGRGGAYSTVRGAYIAGTEIVGCTFNPSCHGYGSGGGDEDPADVENVHRSDTR